MLSIHSKVNAMTVYDNNDNVTIEKVLSKNYNLEKQWNNFSNLEIAIKSHMTNRDANFTIKYIGKSENIHKNIENILNGFKLIVENTTAGGVHVWNMVKIRNKWYHVECTKDH